MALRVINKEGFDNLPDMVVRCRGELDELQTEVQKQPMCEALITKEKEAREKLVAVQKQYTSFLQQKAKLDWLHDGDRNTALFHASIKRRLRQNRVLSIELKDGMKTHDQKVIAAAFLDFYKELLGTKMENRQKVY